MEVPLVEELYFVFDLCRYWAKTKCKRAKIGAIELHTFDQADFRLL